MHYQKTLLAQQIASDPNENIWVNANAGTGKTKVLTDRVLRLLLNDVPSDAILCITFTNNAAAEMQERLLGRAEKWLWLTVEDLEKELTQMLGESPDSQTVAKARTLYYALVDAPQRLHFTTIHGFCQELLNRFSLEADLAPHFTVLSEVQARHILKECAHILFSQRAAHRSANTEEALQYLSEQLHDETIWSLLADMTESREKFAQLFDRVGGRTQMNEAIEQFCALGSLPQPLEQMLAFDEPARDGIVLLAKALSEGGKREQQVARDIAEWLEYDNSHATQLAFLSSALLTQSGTPKKLITEKTREHHPEAEAQLSQLQEQLMHYEDAKKNVQLVRMSKAYLAVAEEIQALYQQRKRQENVLDFNDLIQHSIALLEREDVAPWVLYKLDRRISHILLDEAQDTSPLQWRLIHRLCEEYVSQSPDKSVFVVGDIKQSIYGFQGAVPAEIPEHKAALKDYAEAQERPLKPVDLQRSFRSTTPILELVDSIFEDPKRAHSLHYNDSQIRHSVHREKVWGRVELWPVVQKEQKQEVQPFSIPERYEVKASSDTELAEQIVSQITEWLRSDTLLPSRGRAIRPSDILILVRTRTALVEHIQRGLKRARIPVAGMDRLILQEHIMVQDLLALAQWASMPEDDYSLACILKSPLFGLSEEQLQQYALGREGALFNAILEGGDASLATSLMQIRAWGETLQPTFFFQQVLVSLNVEKRYYAYYGAEASEVLQLFYDMVDELQRSGLLGLTQLIEKFSQQQQVVKQQSDGHNEVRVMTVHGAKGLQAPIVILPDAIKKKTFKQQVFWHKDALLYAPNGDCHSHAFKQVQEAAKLREEQEQSRLLYVALTRAEDWLIIAGHTPYKAIPEDSWYSWCEQALIDMQAKKNEQGVLVLEQGAKQKLQKEYDVQQFPELPDALSQKLPALELVESDQRQSTFQSVEIEYGVLVHRLIELLTPLPEFQRSFEKAQVLCGASLSEEMYNEVMQLYAMPEFSELLKHPVQFEIPVLTKAKQDIQRRAIDCVINTPEAYIILDFKTGAQPADGMIPQAYREQLETYKELMSAHNDDKPWKCGVLWTKAQRIQWI